MTTSTWHNENWLDAQAEALARAERCGLGAEEEEIRQSKEITPNYHLADQLFTRAGLWDRIAEEIEEALKPLPD